MDSSVNGSRDFPRDGQVTSAAYGYPINPTDIFAAAFSPRARSLPPASAAGDDDDDDADKARRLTEVLAPRFVRPKAEREREGGSFRFPGERERNDVRRGSRCRRNGGRRFGFRFGFPQEEGRRKERPRFVTSGV